MSKTIYYAAITERKGSWQSSDGYVLSDDKIRLQEKIAKMPKEDEEHNWEYHPVKSFEATSRSFKLFKAKAKDGILWLDDIEIDDYFYD